MLMSWVFSLAYASVCAYAYACAYALVKTSLYTASQSSQIEPGRRNNSSTRTSPNNTIGNDDALCGSSPLVYLGG